MTQDLISRLTPFSSSTDDDDKDVRKLGYSLVGFLLLGVGGWMTIAPIDSAALAPAVVQVEGKRKLYNIWKAESSRKYLLPMATW